MCTSRSAPCMSVISPAMTPACTSIAAGGVGLALERHSRERRALDARGCLYYRGRRALSSPLVVTHVDRPLPAQMLILSVWLTPVCRSAPAGSQAADSFLHLRDVPRSASGVRPWPGSRCWRTALSDFLASSPPR